MLRGNEVSLGIEEIVLDAKVDYQVFLADFDEELKKLKGGE